MFRIVFYCAKASWQVQVEVTKLLSAPAVANVIGDSSSRMERKKEKDTAPENGSRPTFHVSRHFHIVWHAETFCILVFIQALDKQVVEFFYISYCGTKSPKLKNIAVLKPQIKVLVSILWVFLIIEQKTTF